MKHIILAVVFLTAGSILEINSTIAQAVGTTQIVWRWGVDLKTRLDTLSPVKCDTFGINKAWFRFETDSTFDFPYFPVVYEGMLLFADSAGNVQNIVVKSYEYEYYTGAVIRTGHQNNREIYAAGLPLARHKVGDKGKILRVECVDLQGRKMNLQIPPFYYVKYRQI